MHCSIYMFNRHSSVKSFAIFIKHSSSFCFTGEGAMGNVHVHVCTKFMNHNGVSLIVFDLGIIPTHFCDTYYH